MLRYLEELSIRLALAANHLPESLRRRHLAYLRSCQRNDGGFAGREGESDLYYTGFGLRAMALLGQLEGPSAEKSASFLRSRLAGRESIVDFFSLIYGAALLEVSSGIDVFHDAGKNWPQAVARMLDRLRRDDGGYAKGPDGRASSTYHSFLVILCLELLDIPIPRPDEIVRFLLSQQGVGGGFREIRASKRAGTNPTAAAIAALRILDALDEPLRESTVSFLADMQTDEGGLRANTRIPIADLLSTFTGFLTLCDLDAAGDIDQHAMRKFVESLEREEGGFHAALWDESHDVEYTFYGLATLALLKEEGRRTKDEGRNEEGRTKGDGEEQTTERAG